LKDQAWTGFPWGASLAFDRRDQVVIATTLVIILLLFEA
jgi:hypothetical protein